MQLNLKTLFNGSSEVIPIDCEIDLTGLDIWGQTPFRDPIRVKGEAKRKTEVVTIDYQADFTAQLICDRCGEPFERRYCIKNTHIVLRNIEDEDDGSFIIAGDNLVDFTELVREDIVLEMPFKVLCDENCRGILLN